MLANPPVAGARSADLARPLLPVVAQTLAHLKAREARVVGLRFGLVPGPRTLAGMAAEAGVTQQRLSQIEARALRRCARIDGWPSGLERRFAELARHAPLRLCRVADEPWARGMGQDTFRYVVRTFAAPHLHVAERKRPREGEVPILVPMAELHWRKGLTVAGTILMGARPGAAYDDVVGTIWDAMGEWPVHWRSALLCFLTDGLPRGDLATLRYRHGRRGFLNEHLQAGVEARDRRAWSESGGPVASFPLGAPA